MLPPDFERAAASYDAAAVLAQETGRRMLERLDYIRLQPQVLADIGCATGDGVRALQQRFPEALPLAVDLAPGMLARVREKPGFWHSLTGRGRTKGPHPLCADARYLPLPIQSVQLVWSNLMLHWLNDPLPALREFQRVLDVGGLLMFTALGPDTLKELRAACQSLGIEPPLRNFIDMHDIGDMLLTAGFADPVMDMEMITLSYSSPRALLRDQRHLGCRNALLGSLAWQDWRRVFARFQNDWPQAALPARFEIIHGHAWKPEPRHIEDGRAIVRFGRGQKKLGN